MLSYPKDTETAVAGPVLPSQKGRRGETIKGEVISYHTHGKVGKKKLNCLGMGNWAGSYRTQSKPKGNTS